MQIGDTPTVTLSDPTAQQPTFTLTVTDTGTLVDTDEVAMSVGEDYRYDFPMIYQYSTQ